MEIFYGVRCTRALATKALSSTTITRFEYQNLIREQQKENPWLAKELQYVCFSNWWDSSKLLRQAYYFNLFFKSRQNLKKIQRRDHRLNNNIIILLLLFLSLWTRLIIYVWHNKNAACSANQFWHAYISKVFSCLWVGLAKYQNRNPYIYIQKKVE